MTIGVVRRHKGVSIVFGVVTALVASGAASSCRRDVDGDTRPRITSTTVATAERRRAAAWTDQAAEAYAPLTSNDRALRLPTLVREWLDGTRSVEQTTADLADARAATVEVRDRVAALGPFPFDEHVAPLYVASASLYVEHVRVYQGALKVAPGDGRTQLDLLARRVRLLADRVFDRGQALVKPYLDERPPPNVEIRLPEEVPNWTAEGLAAGPPLAPAPPPPAGPPPLRDERRPTQPRPAWEAAVRSSGAPSAEEVVAAITAGDAPRLASIATALGGAAERLRGIADPDGGREESARVRLSLLLHAEAARGAQAAIVIGVPDLNDVAREVAKAGDRLWSPDLGPRVTFSGGPG